MACELLHALVVFMVGTAASATDRLAPQKQGHQQVKLLSHIYPGVLRLAVDVSCHANCRMLQQLCWCFCT